MAVARPALAMLMKAVMLRFVRAMMAKVASMVTAAVGGALTATRFVCESRSRCGQRRTQYGELDAVSRESVLHDSSLVTRLNVETALCAPSRYLPVAGTGKLLSDGFALSDWRPRGRDTLASARLPCSRAWNAPVRFRPRRRRDRVHHASGGSGSRRATY